MDETKEQKIKNLKLRIDAVAQTLSSSCDRVHPMYRNAIHKLMDAFLWGREAIEACSEDGCGCTDDPNIYYFNPKPDEDNNTK